MNEAGIKKVIIDDYLKRKGTDYAIMINGKWGSGKSYFYDNKLKKEIHNTSVPGTDKKYRTVYISLFGKSTTDDLEIGIRRELVNQTIIDGKKYSNIAGKAAKTVDSIIGGLADFFNVDSKRVVAFFELAEFPDDVVLVFDDLERSKIPMPELLGAINKYAVTDRKKVIVICSEENVDDVFFDFKEKTIRFTLDYTPEREEIFKNIIESRDYTNDYKDFVKSNLSLVMETFDNGGCKNLRTLIFTLDIFEKVFHEIPTTNNYTKDLRKGYLIFTCIYAIEYKNNVSVESLNWFANHTYPYLDIKDPNDPLFSELLGEKINSDKTLSYNKYYSRYGRLCLDDIICSETVSQYIQFGHLDKEKLKEELENVGNELVEAGETNYGIALRKMMDWRLIDDDKLDEVLEEIKTYLLEDKYKPNQISWLYACYLALLDNNIKCLEIKDESFLEAIKRLDSKDKWTPVQYHKNNYAEMDNDLFKWRERGNSYDKRYQSLYDEIIRIDNFYRKNDNKGDELLDLIRGNNLDALKKYVEENVNSKDWFLLKADHLWSVLYYWANKDVQYYIIEVLKKAVNSSASSLESWTFIEEFIANFKDILSNRSIEFGMMKYKEIANALRDILEFFFETRITMFIKDAKLVDTDYIIIDPITLLISKSSTQLKDMFCFPVKDYILSELGVSYVSDSIVSVILNQLFEANVIRRRGPANKVY